MQQSVAIIFGALLVIIGAAGFVVPPAKAPTSGAPAYNVFHLVFGVIGIGLGIAGAASARAFTIGFGAIDLAQLVASRADWYPKHIFRWKPADDLLHLIFGLGLIGIGVLGG